MSLEYLRSFRVLDIAMFDYIGSYLAFVVMFQIFGIENKLRNYLLMMPVAIVSHVLVGQETTVTRKIFSPEFNIFKVYIVLLLATILYLSKDDIFGKLKE